MLRLHPGRIRAQYIPLAAGHGVDRERDPWRSAVVQAASAVGASAAGAYFAGRPNILLLQNHGFLPSINLAGRL